jgi:phosphoglycolate phosphatase
MSDAQPMLKAGSLPGLRALVFDLDGTLVDSAPGIGTSLKTAFNAAGREIPTCDLSSLVGPPINIIARRLEPSLTADEVTVIEKEFRADYDAKGWRKAIPFDGVVEGLLRLGRTGIRLFVVTNKPRIPTEKMLENLGLNAVFEKVLTLDTRIPKYANKTEMLAELIRDQGIEAAFSAMVGDTNEDQEAARGNGVRFIYVTYGYGRVLEADIQVEKFQAIENMLCQGDTER